MPSVYRIRNGKGLWSNGGSRPTFSTRGKAWVSLGALKSHIRQLAERYYGEKPDPNEPWRKLTKRLPDDWQIVEFVVVEENTDLIRPANDVVDQMKRRETLVHHHGEAFANLVDRLEAKDLTETYRWCICHKGSFYDSEQEELLSYLKSKKLKRSTDIQVATSGLGTAIAFKDKSQAMLLRLGTTFKVSSVDIKEFVETELDS